MSMFMSMSMSMSISVSIYIYPIGCISLENPDKHPNLRVITLNVNALNISGKRDDCQPRLKQNQNQNQSYAS